MTYWAKLFLVLIALKNLLANPIPTETPFVPIIDSEDLNNNGIKEFVNPLSVFSNEKVVGVNNNIAPSIFQTGDHDDWQGQDNY